MFCLSVSFREGFELSGDHDPIKVDWQGPPGVLPQLTRSGWLRSIHWLSEVDSTNRHAKLLAEDRRQALPALVVAKTQTGGRGRRGRSWFSDSGTLTFSILLAIPESEIPRDRWPQLALVSGLAVCDVVAEIVDPAEVRLKWPNDVYIDGGKVAGVLIETAGRDNDRVVIGIGLNVATDLSQAPAEVQQRARSIRDFVDMPIDRFTVLPEIIDRIAERIEQWKIEPAAIATAFSQVCLLTGRELTIDTAGQQVAGRCDGIDSDGQLKLHTADGIRLTIRSGEVVSWNVGAEGCDG